MSDIGLKEEAMLLGRQAKAAARKLAPLSAAEKNRASPAHLGVNQTSSLAIN